jgi:hypothetical protein
MGFAASLDRLVRLGRELLEVDAALSSSMVLPRPTTPWR